MKWLDFLIERVFKIFCVLKKKTNLVAGFRGAWSVRGLSEYDSMAHLQKRCQQSFYS